MVTMWLGAAQAAAPPTGAVVTMVCHESGGSGLPLTDYVNNLDFGISITGGVPVDPSKYVPSPLPSTQTVTLKYNDVVLTDIQTETDASPTSCAIATSMLIRAGFKLVSTFSHFTGYYVEVFTS
jgi:hypothetical protein